MPLGDARRAAAPAGYRHECRRASREGHRGVYPMHGFVPCPERRDAHEIVEADAAGSDP
jgi:hypothetical protein